MLSWQVANKSITPEAYFSVARGMATECKGIYEK
jgi:hypothetical protein